jgi:hypothetical protein
MSRWASVFPRCAGCNTIFHHTWLNAGGYCDECQGDAQPTHRATRAASQPAMATTASQPAAELMPLRRSVLERLGS